MMRQILSTTILTLGSSLLLATTLLAEEPKTITRLLMRDRTIIVNQTATGLQYSLVKQDGTVVDADLNEKQLSARYPEVYQQVKEAFAQPEANSENTIWSITFPAFE